VEPPELLNAKSRPQAYTERIRLKVKYLILTNTLAFNRGIHYNTKKCSHGSAVIS
jgi:hypothetical protein